MERQRERLVESIFSRAKQKRSPAHKPSSLFQAAPPAPKQQAVSKPPTSDLVERKFPLGLDLGDSSFTWVQLGVVQGKTRVIEMGSEPLKLPLRQAVSQRRLSGPVVLSLPLEDVSLRLFKLAALPESEMEQAIRWQVEQTLPPDVSYEEFSVDYLLLEEAAGQESSSVLVAMAPRQRVLTLVEQAKEAGLEPIAVEIDPFAAASCLARLYPFKPEETILVFHLSASSASLSVLANNQLAFSRSLLTTGRVLTQAVADYLRVPLEEAETLKRTHGLLDSAEAAGVARALASPLETLLVDAVHAFKSFSHQVTQSKRQRFDRIILAGGAARLPGLAPWLRARMEAPVEYADPLGIFPMSDALKERQPWGEISPQLVVAMGLALREVPSL